MSLGILVGIVAQIGIENRNGILLAAKHKKTILGRPIKLIIGFLSWSNMKPAGNRNNHGKMRIVD